MMLFCGTLISPAHAGLMSTRVARRGGGQGGRWSGREVVRAGGGQGGGQQTECTRDDGVERQMIDFNVQSTVTVMSGRKG